MSNPQDITNKTEEVVEKTDTKVQQIGEKSGGLIRKVTIIGIVIFVVFVCSALLFGIGMAIFYLFRVFR